MTFLHNLLHCLFVMNRTNILPPYQSSPYEHFYSYDREIVITIQIVQAISSASNVITVKMYQVVLATQKSKQVLLRITVMKLQV